MRFPALIATIIAFLVAGAASDSRTGHYLECLHKDQCKGFTEPRCCPTGFCCHKYTMHDGKNVTSKCVSEEDQDKSSDLCKTFSLTPEQLRDPGHFVKPLRLEIVEENDYPAVLNLMQDQFVGETDKISVINVSPPT